ncbi:MAG: hypothetical protein ACOZNI_07170 [Myxococcota bacterium]
MGGWLVGDNETPDRLFRYDRDMKRLADVPMRWEVDDLEALAPTSDGALWVVGSQSANKDGKVRPSRERIARLSQRLITPDLTACGPCVAARGVAPNRGGLNVEGAVDVGGKLWLGLRAPLVGGKALLVETDEGKASRFLEVDLGGAGIRELVPWRGGVLAITGPVDDTAADHGLWWLATIESAPVRLPVSLPPRTEGLAVADDGQAIWVTDGDGKAGDKCEEPARWGRVTVPAPP